MISSVFAYLNKWEFFFCSVSSDVIQICMWEDRRHVELPH